MLKSKPIIVQICRDATDTGGGRVALEISKYFALSGYKVIIITDTICDVDIHDVSFQYTSMGQLLKDWKAGNKITKTLRHLLQLVVFMFTSYFELTKIKDKKITINHNLESLAGDVYVIHNVFNYENKNKPILKRLLRWFNPVFFIRAGREYLLLRLAYDKKIICVSEQTLSEARAYCPSSSNLSYINNGVNADFFSYKKRFLKQKEFNLIFVGHEFERKGLEYVIKSLLLVPEYIKLYIVGGAGSSRKKYEELIDEHNLQGRVIFKGTILGQDLVTLYHKCDLFVLPSKYEAWPLVGLESMSCGLPVLMTNVGGIPEYLKDGLNGFFITQNGKDIAEKVNVISSKKELYEQMSANARQTALKHSWNACAQKYLNVIEQ